MTKQLSQASLARALGLSPPAVTKLKKLGMPTTSVQAARAWREQHQSVARRKPEPTAASPGAIPDFNESRARHEAALAALRELELGEAQGRLLDRRRVETAAFEAARWLRDQLGGAAGSLGAEVAGLSEAVACEAAIQREHRRLLESFVRELATMAGTPPAAPAPAAEVAPE